MQQIALECPQCNATLDATPQLLGEIIDCNDCSSELEVTNLTPLTVQLAPEIEEDWGE